MKKQDKGFTLVELLIVIVILGILATVTVFAVRGITNQGQESACAATEKTLQTAAESYFAANAAATIPSEAPVDADGNALLDSAGVALPASTQGALVNAGLLVDVSPEWTLSANGVTSPAAGGDCV